MLSQQQPEATLWARTIRSSPMVAVEQRPLVRLKVKSLQRSVEFYEKMFDQSKTTLHEGSYAYFDLSDPPLNLVLIEDPDAISYEGHMGIQLKEMAHVNAYRNRMQEAGIEIYVTETEVACCYAVQNKVWVRDPDENSWEFFMVVERNVAQGCGDVCACKGCGDFE